MVFDEPYHDGTSPDSRYETDKPAGWVHLITRHVESWAWRRLVRVWHPLSHPDHWCVDIGGETFYASTAWLALCIVRRELGEEVPPFCEECDATRGLGV